MRFSNSSTALKATAAAYAICLAFGLQSQALAETDEEMFKRLDATESGYLSGTETGGITQYDSNNDKRITKEEFLAGRQTQTKTTTAGAPAEAQKPKTNVTAAASVPGDHSLEGLFLQVQTSYGMNGSLNFNQVHFFFSKEGRVYRGVPEEGVDDFNFDTACAKNPKNCGQYGISGDKITLAWPERTQNLGFARKGDDIELDGLFASKVGKMTPGQTLDGNYSKGGTAGGGGTFVSSAQSMRFNADGTFERSSVGGVSIDSNAVSAGASSNSSNKETYRIGTNTLELKHADGKTTKHTIYPFDMGDGRVDISIDGGTMKKEN